jgi:hypothetical protein
MRQKVVRQDFKKALAGKMGLNNRHGDLRQQGIIDFPPDD